MALNMSLLSKSNLNYDVSVPLLCQRIPKDFYSFSQTSLHFDMVLDKSSVEFMHHFIAGPWDRGDRCRAIHVFIERN